MTTITGFVQTAAYEITPSQFRVHGSMWSILMSLNHVHVIWRWYRRGTLYSNPDNFVQLLGGHAVNYVFSETTFLKIAAQSLLIATRLLTCAQQQASLYREGKRLIAAVKGHYPHPVEVPWTTHSSSFLFSPSSLYEWKTFSISIWNRISRIAFIITRLFFKALTLSMCVMDAIDAFYISPTTKNEAINESCLNVIQWLDALVDKKETLLQGITEHKDIIERILKGSPFTYTQLQRSITSALNATETFQQQTKKITSFGNGLILDIGKRSLHGALVVTGMPASLKLLSR